MVRSRLLMPVLVLVLRGIAGFSNPSNTVGQRASADKAFSYRDLTQLFGPIWQTTDAPSKPASGSIYVFLANGTLLETSCVETYRIATWTINGSAPAILHVVEDKQLAFTMVISELTEHTLRFQQTLARSKEKRDITLKAVEREFVCPDLPR